MKNRIKVHLPYAPLLKKTHKSKALKSSNFRAFSLCSYLSTLYNNDSSLLSIVMMIYEYFPIRQITSSILKKLNQLKNLLLLNYLNQLIQKKETKNRILIEKYLSLLLKIRTVVFNLHFMNTISVLYIFQFSKSGVLFRIGKKEIVCKCLYNSGAGFTTLFCQG